VLDCSPTCGHNGNVRVMKREDGELPVASRQEQHDQRPMGEGAGRDMTRFEGVFELLYFVFQSRQFVQCYWLR
jgi:hypothetical protein